ncbi:MAG: sulfite exporter TauE/SafE family protein [Bacteroidota bacterium]
MLYTAFTFGLLGSLHCVGMCGPLALAMPFGQRDRLLRVLVYNAGRILTYATLGALLGLLGQGIFLVGLQSWLTLALGILLIVIGLFSVQLEFNIWTLPGLSSWYLKVKAAFGRLMEKSTYGSLFSVGLLNGLLPCGLVYLALAGALTTANWQSGISYMIIFGLGTLPLLLAVTMLGQLSGRKIQTYLRKAYPVVLTLMGGFLIWRALQFQLPADFSLWEAMNNAPMCH